MAIPPNVEPGDLWRAIDANRIKDQAFRGVIAGKRMRVAHTSREMIVSGSRGQRVRLFELTEGWTVPDPGTYSTGDGDTAYTENAQPVLYDSRAAVDEYDRSTDSLATKTLYAPHSFLGASGETIGHPPAASGQRVWAAYNRQSGRWEVLNAPHDVWRFQLTETLTAGSNATANLLPWTGAAYAEDSDVQFEVYDALTHFSGADGDKGYAKWMPDRGVWEIVHMDESGLTIRKFELKDALTPGSNATAYLREWSGSAWVTDTGTEFEVYDERGVYRGRAKSGSAGSYGEATFNAESSRWEITWLQPHALMIRCTANESVATDTTPFDVTGVEILNQTGAILLAAVTELDNTDFEHAIDNGGTVYAVWSEEDVEFRPVQAKCPA